MIKSRYYWPNMDKNIRQMGRSCQDCQQNKIFRHTKTQTTPYLLPSGRFETVHIDIIGPLPPETAHNDIYPSPTKYILTCINRKRWIEATLLQDTSASTAVAFHKTGIDRFGVLLNVRQREPVQKRIIQGLIHHCRIPQTPYNPIPPPPRKKKQIK